MGEGRREGRGREGSEGREGGCEREKKWSERVLSLATLVKCLKQTFVPNYFQCFCLAAVNVVMSVLIH